MSDLERILMSNNQMKINTVNKKNDWVFSGIFKKSLTEALSSDLSLYSFYPKIILIKNEDFGTTIE